MWWSIFGHLYCRIAELVMRHQRLVVQLYVWQIDDIVIDREILASYLFKVSRAQARLLVIIFVSDLYLLFPKVLFVRLFVTPFPEQSRALLLLLLLLNRKYYSFHFTKVHIFCPVTNKWYWDFVLKYIEDTNLCCKL